jgi:hypothetical protein
LNIFKYWGSVDKVRDWWGSKRVTESTRFIMAWKLCQLNEDMKKENGIGEFW